MVFRIEEKTRRQIMVLVRNERGCRTTHLPDQSYEYLYCLTSESLLTL